MSFALGFGNTRNFFDTVAMAWAAIFAAIFWGIGEGIKFAYHNKGSIASRYWNLRLEVRALINSGLIFAAFSPVMILIQRLDLLMLVLTISAIGPIVVTAGENGARLIAKLRGNF